MASLLRLGSQGPQVTQLQQSLNRLVAPQPALALDGRFGPGTEAAVKKFQTARGIKSDGIVGPDTARMLGLADPQDVTPPPVPAGDGQITRYKAVAAYGTEPIVYYVNGIQTDGAAHAQSLQTLSILTEHEITGIYNKTGGVGTAKGFVFDLGQCLADWGSGTGHKILEATNRGLNAIINGAREKLGIGTDPVNVAGSIRDAMPEQARVWLVQHRLKLYNRATAALFNELRTNRTARQLIVAHSQGNLITADALWAMVIAYGEDSLANMQVYSLASPSPAWPLGIRYKRKVYGHTNDPVTLADPHNWSVITSRLLGGMFGRAAGDWRSRENPSSIIEPHDIKLNMFELNFANRIRRDLGLPPIPGSPEPPR